VEYLSKLERVSRHSWVSANASVGEEEEAEKEMGLNRFAMHMCIFCAAERLYRPEVRSAAKISVSSL